MLRRLFLSILIVGFGAFGPVPGMTDSLDGLLPALGAGNNGSVSSNGLALPDAMPGLGELDADTTVPLRPGTRLGASQRGLANGLAAPAPEDDSAHTITGGLPGIDGLNTAPAAFSNALGGLEPSLVRAVLRDVDPAVLSQFTQGLATTLPGLEKAGDLSDTLPGIDGLPVRPPLK